MNKKTLAALVCTLAFGSVSLVQANEDAPKKESVKKPGKEKDPKTPKEKGGAEK